MIRINGYELPDLLVRLLDEGAWGPDCRDASFDKLPIEDKDDLTLFDVSAMVRNTQELYDALARGEGPVLALSHGAAALPGVLDVSRAVLIAATRGQEALALDYSQGVPARVVATTDTSWVEVARDFDELARMIGLAGASDAT